MAALNPHWIFAIVILICVHGMKAVNDDIDVDDGETDITYDEEVDIFDVMPTVDIALSSFVVWNMLSILGGMCACCFIQSGYAHFADQEPPPPKETPY